ncbi:glycosyl transferase family 90-domain-containing protein [Mycena latifolia]|nr:glycosyl transferase family 90-domain-containing protein [Mycena latifolia]
MPYDPASTVARPLLALATSPSSSAFQSSHHRRHPLLRRPRALLLLAAGVLTLLALTVLLGPAVGLPELPIPDRLAGYYRPPPPPPFPLDGDGGNEPPPPGGGAGHGAHGHPRPPPPEDVGAHAPLDVPEHPPPPPPVDSGAHAPLDVPPPSSPPSSPPPSPPPADSNTTATDPAVSALLASQPATLAAARARYSLKTGRVPPRGFDAFVAFAQERGCLVDAYAGARADFAPFWAVERALSSASPLNSTSPSASSGWFRERVKAFAARLAADERDGRGAHGMSALRIKDGRVQRAAYQGTYFDGDWEATIGKFAAALPDMTLLINGRDEPRVVFDTQPLFAAGADVESLTHPTDATPFALSPPATAQFFAPRAGCGGEGAQGGVPFLLSASSAEFTTDLVPVLSMAKLADGAGVSSAGGGSAEAAEGGRGATCFADIVVPGEFYYRTSWWAGQFKYPDNVPWGGKKGVLYWRGKSNGGHIRGSNYKAFPRFRLIDLASAPENQRKGLFDVRITEWHEGHCTDDCDADAIRAEYNITGETAPREEAYGFKYLLDVDGNTFSGRYLGLLRSGGLVFKSTAFAEFFTPWLVPYEHFIPVRPDLADLPAKIEWARANDAEAHRIQEAGRVFAERVLTDAQNDCYWFAVLLEWGALWGEEAP